MTPLTLDVALQVQDELSACPMVGHRRGPCYIKRSKRGVYEVVDLDAWMEDGIRWFMAEAVEE